MTNQDRFRLALDTIGTIALVIAAGVLVSTRLREGTNVTAGAPTPAGRPSAVEKVTLQTKLGGAIQSVRAVPMVIIEFADFQCPYCGKFATETYPDLKRDYIDTGRVRFVFRHDPLETIHPFAMKASQAAECAGEQNRYWEMHRLLFSNQRELNDVHLIERAEAVGLDSSRFKRCLDGVPLTRIKDDQSEAARLGVQSTPTFLIGRVQSDGTVAVSRRINGAVPYDTFKSVLKEIM